MADAIAAAKAEAAAAEEAARAAAAEKERIFQVSRSLRYACYECGVAKPEDKPSRDEWFAKIKELYGQGGDPSKPDEGLGETALHYAAVTGAQDICEYLVEVANVKIGIKNERFDTAWNKALTFN